MGHARHRQQPAESLLASTSVDKPLALELDLGNMLAIDMQSKSLSQSDDLKKAADIARSSTASLGKFQENLSRKLEKTSKTKTGNKRKFESNTVDNATETERSLSILSSITNKSARLDLDA